MNNIFLKTDRLILRRLEESDFPDYAAYAVDDEMSRMMGRPILKTEADIRINFNWLKDMEPRCYGIMEKSRSHLIGNLSVCAVPAQLTGLEQLQGRQGLPSPTASAAPLSVRAMPPKRSVLSLRSCSTLSRWISSSAAALPSTYHPSSC